MGKANRRGNGQGYVIKIRPGCYKAIVTIGYKDNDYRQPIRRTRSGFKTKADAIAYLPYLRTLPAERREKITLKTAFDRWIEGYSASKSTLNCYRAGFAIFSACWFIPLDYQEIDKLQACMDGCDKGKRTRENAKACLGLVYKWAIPRGYVDNNLNLAQFLKVGDGEQREKRAFTPAQIETIRKAIGTVPYADYIYCHCYLGFRPAELLALRVIDYNEIDQTLIGGSKTEAGIDRTVTISPKIAQIVCDLANRANGGYIFGRDGKKLPVAAYRDAFYLALDKMGIQKADDHTLTPHCCRHTFATLMKAVQAPDKDKMRLIGHASPEQLRYYQDVDLADLRKITDKL